ncbi:MAG: ABC transporter permease [Dehalococcoidia bacterium]
MNHDVFMLTLRMLLGRRRTLLLLLFAGLPVLLAVVFRLSADDVDAVEWTANALLGGMIVAILLPLSALVFGTAAFGAESEDGTIVYILARPLRRWTIVTAKLAASVLATAVLVLPAALFSALIALSGADGGMSLVAGFVAGIAGGIVVYTALFLCLGILTGRAFIIGLGYVFVWEGVVTGIFRGTRNLSVREYVLGVAGGIADVPKSAFEADVSLATAVVMMVLVAGAAIYFAIRGAQRFQVGESG